MNRQGGVAVAVRSRLRQVWRRARTRISGPAARAAKGLAIDLPVDDVLRADYVSRPYVPPAPTGPKEALDIAWVIPRPRPGGGGLTTISRFAKHQIRVGHRVTFYLADREISTVRLDGARQVLRDAFGLDVQVLSLRDFAGADVVLATYWPSAYAVFNLDTDAHKFYFVQDFEPYFYEVGTNYMLAENTYRMGLRGITAGRWLAKKVKEYGMEADCFEFGADLDVYQSPSSGPRRRRVCFYARPSTGRRAFELGVLALKLVHTQRPDIEIALFGADLSDYTLPFPYTDYGQLTPKGLASLYQESIACLVLSLTNVSLLPLELLAAGCIPVMNAGENNRAVLEGVDEIVYTGTSPAELAGALIAAVDRHIEHPESADRAGVSVSDRSWEQSYVAVERVLMREVTGLGVGADEQA